MEDPRTASDHFLYLVMYDASVLVVGDTGLSATANVDILLC
jgi:hypothetical protein